MAPECRLAFLLLTLAQAAHSIEEYAGGLYRAFAPARFVSSLASSDLSLGFLMANVALMSFGLWCWAVPVRSRWPSARGFAWFWTLLELGNASGHLFLAFTAGAYFPGAAPAPLLLLLAARLAVLQR